MGSTHNETWYILGSGEEYVVLVDCSYMSGWINVGSIVWVRPNHVLTSEEMSEIADIYDKKMGWKFPADFCYDKHGESECGNGPSYPEEPVADRDFLRVTRGLLS